MTNINLDDPKALRQTDTADMLSNIADLPNQIKKGWDDINRMALPSYLVTCNRVVICGMGGSGIGGDLVRSVVVDETRTPIYIHRDYSIPTFIDNKTLVIADSFSGNTEETLDAFISAQQKGAKIFVITTGGELERLAKKFKVPFYKIIYKSEPRAAIGFPIGAILAIFKKIGILEMTEDEIIRALTHLKDYNETLFPDSPHRKNQAKQIAKETEGFLPIFYASEKMTSVARRWRSQLSENAKVISFYDTLPEVNHTSTNGLDLPKDANQLLKFYFLQSKFDNPRIKTRMRITAEVFEKKSIIHRLVEIKNSPNLLTEILALTLLADYTSYYLSIINGVDPSSLENVNYIKRRLKELE
jgi:glucose/mannose-6-phosphate isomerase